MCTAFQPTIFNGRKCYSLDVNEILVDGNVSVNHGSSNGLSLLIDTNNDRHFGSEFDEQDMKNNIKRRKL